MKIFLIRFILIGLMAVETAWGQTPGPFEQFPFENCTDGIDNDADGDVDCYDSQCALTLHELCFATSPPSRVTSPPPAADQGVLASASMGLAFVAAASTLLSLVSATAAAQSGPELLRSLLPFSAVHRRQAPWGRVVAARSNQAVAGVRLSLIDEGGKVRATEKTRRDGTFGFFTPAGTYRLIAQQDGYQFPAPAPDVALFPGETVYDGGWIHVTEESILALAIVGQELSQTDFANLRERFQGLWTRVQVWQARLAMPLLLVGGALTLLSFWNRPSGLLGVLLGVYAVLFGLELLLSRVARRAVGVVRDAVTKRGVGLAVVRLSDQFGHLVATRVTLENGHFFLMPSPGTYRVEIIHPNYQLYVKERFPVRKFFFGVAGIRVKLLSR